MPPVSSHGYLIFQFRTYSKRLEQLTVEWLNRRITLDGAVQRLVNFQAFQRLAKLLKAVGGEGCYLYCLDTVLPSSVAHARFFNPTMGIVEDSATGTAAGSLACQLVNHEIVKDGSTIMIEQGYEIKRPSILRVEVHGKTVRLAGRAVKVIEGRLRIE